MSFHPISSGNLGESLGGTATTIGIRASGLLESNIRDPRDVSLEERHIHGPAEKRERPVHIVIVIIISAILFVTIVSLYDVLRAWIINYYAEITLKDPISNNTENDIRKTLLANWNSFKAAAFFACMCVVTSAFFIFALIVIMNWFAR